MMWAATQQDQKSISDDLNTTWTKDVVECNKHNGAASCIATKLVFTATGTRRRKTLCRLEPAKARIYMLSEDE
jgi:hypothetical protein